MSEQEHIPFWQIVRLRLRTLLGWGYDVPELRHYASVYARGARGMPVFMAAELALILVAFDILPHMGIGASRPASLSFVVGLSLPMLALPLLLMVVFTFLSVRYSRRAEAGERQLPVTFDGCCYVTVIEPPEHLFALIGMTRDQAQWFCLPIEWVTTVGPCDDHFELTYTPATGYVERLRRIGAEPRELRQGGEAPTSAAEAEKAGAMDGKATPAQQRELLSAVHHESSAWGAYSGAILSYGLSFVSGGFILVIAGIVMAVVLPMMPSKLSQADNTHLLIFMCLALGLPLLCFIPCAVVVLRAWERQSRAEMAPPVTIEGSQVCWMPFHDFYGTRDESLVVVRLDDDDNVIFRIPGQWMHRVRQPNARVRVTYNEQTWLVLDYRAVEAAPTRTSA